MNKINSAAKIQMTTTQLFAPDSYASNAKGKRGFSRIVKAVGYSLNDFKAAYKYEAAFR